MRSTPGPGNPEMARRLAEQQAVEEKFAHYAVNTRRILYGFILVVTLMEVLRWLV